MVQTEQHAEAPAQVQIESILKEMQKIKYKLEDAKAVLKGYPIKSDKLTQLKKARKELKEQIDEEVDEIESKHYEDKDFEQACNDKLTYKNQLKEKTAELRQLVTRKHKVPVLETEDHLVEGEQMKLQFEFPAKLYLNGRELK